MCVWFWNTVFSTPWFIEALYEKKQTTMTSDSKIAKLQSQVEELEANSAVKDTLIAKYEYIVKESEGENIGYYEIHVREGCFPEH